MDDRTRAWKELQVPFYSLVLKADDMSSVCRELKCSSVTLDNWFDGKCVPSWQKIDLIKKYVRRNT